MELATFGSGCFWCTEAVFERLQGVEKVISGYAGGDPKRTDYRSVTTGTTGHAEVVQVTFDPSAVSYDELLDLFFVSHDPTTLNRQGADVGSQYRSVIFFHSPEQEAVARRKVEEAQGAFEDPIVTEISPLDTFFPAEDYHQDYFRNNPRAGYCSFVIAPKLKKLEARGAL